MSTLRTSFLKNEASSTNTIKLNPDGSCSLNNAVLDGVVTISGALGFGTASLPTASDMGGVLLSGSLTSSNPTIVLTSTANLSGGMLVTGEGIPAGTTLTNIFTNASGTLSSNATATTTFKPVTFYRNDKLLTPASVGGQLCRAWVNFNGGGTIAIRAAYNVSSITDNGTGDYTINFATSMPDGNYCAAVSNAGIGFSFVSDALIGIKSVAASSLRIFSTYIYGTDRGSYDQDPVMVSIFR